MTEIVWNDASEAQWAKVLSACSRSSLEQSWCYGAASETMGFRVDRGVIMRDSEAVGLVQGMTKRFFGLATVTQILRGPLWTADVDDATTAPVMDHLRRRFTKGALRFVYWVPELTDNPAARAAMRKLHLRRVMTGYSSSWVDLGPDENDILRRMSGQWRNMIRRSAREKISLRVSHGGQDLETLLQRCDAERKSKRYRGPSGRFMKLVTEGAGRRKDILAISAYRKRDLLAGVLMIRHGTSATYYASWTGDEGRAARAHNALIWRGIQTLRQDGVRWLDVGGIDTTTAPGVARFKLGLGGDVFTLAGSYL